MKTTVEIEDHLLERAKREARRRKTTLRRLIEEGLRQELAKPAKRTAYRMKDRSVGGDGLLPGVVTNPRIFLTPSTMDEVDAQIDEWRLSPWFVFLPEAVDHLTHLRGLLRASGAVGSHVHDAKIAAICLGHDVDEIWSADRDFRKFPGLRVVNPLVAK